MQLQAVSGAERACRTHPGILLRRAPESPTSIVTALHPVVVRGWGTRYRRLALGHTLPESRLPFSLGVRRSGFRHRPLSRLVILTCQEKNPKNPEDGCSLQSAEEEAGAPHT